MSPEVINGLFAVGGAVVGALIGGVFAMYAARTARDRKELTVSEAHPSRLLAVHDRYRETVEVRVAGKLVDNVMLSEIYISNTGNTTVQHLNFTLSCAKTCDVLSAEVLDQSDDRPRSGAEVSRENDKCLNVNIDYINPGEEVTIRTLITGDSPSWNVPIRQPDLIVQRREGHTSTYSDVFALAMFRSIERNPLMHAYFKLALPAYRKYAETAERERRSSR